MDDYLAQGISITMASYLICMFLFNRVLHHSVCHRKLSEASAYLIANHVVSSCHACVAFLTGGFIIWRTNDDIMFSRSVLCDYYPWCAVGYGVYDLTSIYSVYGVREYKSTQFSLRQLLCVFKARPMIICHHVGLFLFAFPVVLWWRNGKGDFFVGCFLLFECSTPSVMLRAILAEVGMKSSKLYIINGVLMLVSWFCSRILTVPYMFLRYSQYSGVPLTRLSGKMPNCCLLGSALLLSLQVYWFILMLNGARRVLLHRDKNI